AADVDQHRARGLLLRELADAAGVLADAAIRLHADVLAAHSRDPGAQAAVAEAKYPSWLAFLLCMMECSGDVEDGDIGFEHGIEVFECAVEVVSAVAKLHIAFVAVEDRRRNAEEALRRVVVGHGANGFVDTENLLYHDHSPYRFLRRL